MNNDLIKKRVERSKRISALKHMIKDELSRNQDELVDRQIFLNEKYKPVTESQKKVIKTVNDNQKNLQESVNTLSSILSNQGSTTGVEEWLER